MSETREATPSLTPLQDGLAEWAAELRALADDDVRRDPAVSVTFAVSTGIPELLRPLVKALDEGLLRHEQKAGVLLSTCLNVITMCAGLMPGNPDDRKRVLAEAVIGALTGALQPDISRSKPAIDVKIPQRSRQ